MPDLDGLLAQKYAIMGRQADAQMLSAQGQFNLSNAQAGMVAPQAHAAINEQNARGDYYAATAGQVKPLAQSEIGLRANQGSLYAANAGQVAPLAQSTINYQGANAERDRAMIPALRQGSVYLPVANTLTPSVSAGGMPQPDPLLPNHAKGVSRIKAPGDGTVDTTQANLANGEAVLNAGAASHLGQPAIQALNAIGAARMGMVPGSTQDDRVKGANAAQTAGNPSYAKGVSKVAAKKGKGSDKGKDKPDKAGGSDTPSLDKIDPKMLAAALQMGAMGQQGGQPPQEQLPPGGAPMGMM
jgi:hypothetical protein